MKNKLMISIPILLLVLLVIVIFNVSPTIPQTAAQQVQQVQPTLNSSPSTQNLLPSNYSTGVSYEEAVKIGKPMVVNFYVDWCHYCKAFAPKLEELRLEYKDKYTFVLVKADDPKNKDIVEDYNVNGYPSLFLVNPKNDNRVFIEQSLYGNKNKMEKELNRFLRLNK